MIWERADKTDIDPKSYYLVKDNGCEWRDFDLHVMSGFMIARKLHPDYVRGRPEWVAKITQTPALSSAQRTEK